MLEGMSVLEKLTKEQASKTKELFAPKGDQEKIIEAIQSILPTLKVLDDIQEDTKELASNSKESLNIQKKENDVATKIAPTAMDLLELSAPNSLGYLYLGNVITTASNNFASSLPKFLRKLTVSSSSEKDAEKKPQEYDNIWEALRGDISDVLGLKDKKFSALKKSGGILGGIVTSIVGANGLLGISKKLPLTSLLPQLAAPIATLGLGLVTATIDGISGYFKSDSWNTSKFSAVLGGFLGGTSDNKLASTFKGFGKWGLVGFGLGGPIGAVIGGVLGAVFGLIGGKNIASGLDKVGLWVKDTFTSIGGGIKDIFSDIGETFIKMKKKWSPIFTPVKTFITEDLPEWFSGIKQQVTGILKIGKEKVLGVWNSIMVQVDKVSAWVVQKKNTVSQFFLDKWDLISGIFKGVFNTVTSSLSGVYSSIKKWVTDKRTFLKESFSNIANGIYTFFTDIPANISLWGKEKIADIKEGFSFITDSIKTFFTSINIVEWTTSKVKGIKEKVSNITSGLGDWFSARKDDVSNLKKIDLSSLQKSAKSKIEEMFNIDLSEFSGDYFTNLLKEKVLTPVTDFFGGIGDFFSYLQSYFSGGFIKGIKNLAGDLVKGEFNEGMETFKEEQAKASIKESPKYKELVTSEKYQNGTATQKNMWEQDFIKKELTSVKDAIFKTTEFKLKDSYEKGSLFNKEGNGVEIDPDDDLYLVASTNPAQDAMSQSIDKLSTLIEKLAESIDKYKPQINNTVAPVKERTSAIRDLLEMA